MCSPDYSDQKKASERQLIAILPFENDQKDRNGLDGYLKARNFSKLVMCGLATDYCVAFSARDAVRCGYQVEIVLPACRTIDLDGSLHTPDICAMKAEGVVLREGLVE